MKIRCEDEGMTILAQILPRRRNSSLFALYPVPCLFHIQVTSEQTAGIPLLPWVCSRDLHKK